MIVIVIKCGLGNERTPAETLLRRRHRRPRPLAKLPTSCGDHGDSRSFPGQDTASPPGEAGIGPPQRPGPPGWRRKDGEPWDGAGRRGLSPRLFPEEIQHTGKRFSEVSGNFSCFYFLNFFFLNNKRKRCSQELPASFSGYLRMRFDRPWTTPKAPVFPPPSQPLRGFRSTTPRPGSAILGGGAR